eukprot:TRINITY_DN48419_c0_g1_i1.p2 TRINITY_DN48419_c0_g1~~TRINITY_DN48419_c0_g1_i1.p2  ORF type:complete len:102 (-),score=17.71 TRINITY_DN48419_c0_g1_i1:390-695(-)
MFSSSYRVSNSNMQKSQSQPSSSTANQGLDILVKGTVSSMCPQDLNDDDRAAIQAGDASRLAQGYNADGKLGGQFSKENPPPGKTFSAYKLGFTGILWKDA